MAKTVYILDGHYQIYRSYYAPFRDLNSPTGEPTRATHVFMQGLLNLLKGRKPDYLVMAMDVSDETVFRRDLDPGYKANREAPPTDFHVQRDRILQIVQTLGVPIVTAPGFEADDVMASLSEQLRAQDVKVYFVSRDKDLEQLLTDRVHLYDVANDEVIDPAALLEKKGYTPKQAVEVQTLCGDSTDNIPGIDGVGLKTAAKLVGQYGSADAVVSHADELTPKLKERVKAFAPQLPITRQLVTLRRDVPVSVDLETARTDRLNYAAVRPIFEHLGFRRLSDQLGEFIGTSAPQQAVQATLFDEPLATSDQRGTYTLVDTPEALANLARALAAQPRVAIDTETTGLNPVDARLVGFSCSWKAGEGYYVPVRGLGRTASEEQFVAALRAPLEDARVEKIGHNLKYDVTVLRQVGIRVGGVAFDTVIASFLLDPLRQSHSLDNLVLGLLGHRMIPITDLIGKGKGQLTMEQVDTARSCEYAGEDADFTWRLYEVLAPKIAGHAVEKLFCDTEMPLVEVLAEMEHTGVRVNAGILKRLGDQMGERLIELTREVHRLVGRPFNLDSTKQLAEVLFDDLRLPVVRRTKTGRSTDAETLEELAATTDNPVPKLILEYRELAKLKGTYVDTLPKMICARTGRVHTSYNQTGAVTGRLSSDHPNLQNIPIRTQTGAQIRSAFVAGDADHVLLTADYSQIELRLLAHFCRDEALLQAFREGRDIHAAVAAEVNGVPLEQVTPRQRSAAKAVNFGIIYGQTAFGLSRALGISNTDAKAFIEQYFARYPKIRFFINRCIRDARDKGYAETILGRRRPITQLSSSNRGEVALGERLAVNTVVQGSAADLIKRAMVDIHRTLAGGGYSARMLLQVHDELVFEVRRDSVEREATMIREKMTHAIPLDVPVAVDINWGESWLEGK